MDFFKNYKLVFEFYVSSSLCFDFISIIIIFLVVVVAYVGKFSWL